MQESTDLRESLSALLDGEESGDAAKFLARRLERDPALAAQIGRWQFAGDVLRAASSRQPEVDLRASIQQALVQEAQAVSAKPAYFNGMKKWLGGVAMAAALGVIAVAVKPGLDKAEMPADVVAEVTTSPNAMLPVAPPATSSSTASMTASLPVRSDAPVASGDAVVDAPTVRPWRVPADTDALIARANTPKAEPVERPRQVSRQGTAIAAVPKSIQRAGDVERVLRGKSEEGVLGVDPAAHPGWPRSVIPGVDGAFNASFNTGRASPFGAQPVSVYTQP